MTRLLIYTTILIDLALPFLVQGLKWIYRVDNDISARSFEIYKTLIVPVRDTYIMMAFIANILLIGVLITRYYRNGEKEHFGTIEKLGLILSLVTLVIISFIKLFFPSGPFF